MQWEWILNPCTNVVPLTNCPRRAFVHFTAIAMCVIVTLHVKEQRGATFVFVTEDLQYLISLFNSLLLIKSVQNKPQYSEK